MLPLVIAAEVPSPEQSYGGLLITGVVTITVALIGFLAARGRRNHEPSPDNEPQWLKDLRGENRRLRHEAKEKDDKLDGYERVMMIWRIDPQTGRRLPDVDEAFPSTSTTTRHPSPVPPAETE